MPIKAIFLFWLYGILHAYCEHENTVCISYEDGFFCKANILYYLITFFPFII